jgi:hypothetical protein
MIYKNQVPINGRQSNNNYKLTGLTDVYLNSNTNYSYKVRAYDFANNLSEPTSSITINTGVIPIFPNNVSLGCPYTISFPDYKIDSKTKNTKLTDGKYSNSASANDSAWVGFHDNEQKLLVILIDLGKVTPVQQFIVDFLNEPKALVYLPEEVKVLFSKDNIGFISVGEFPHPNLSDVETASSYKFRLTLTNSLDARYIKFVIKPNERWFDALTFIDEIEVRNNASSDKRSTKK